MTLSDKRRISLFGVGDLVRLDDTYMKNYESNSQSKMRLWQHEDPHINPLSVSDDLYVGELSIVLSTSDSFFRMAKVLSPRGIPGWIARINLVLVQAADAMISQRQQNDQNDKRIIERIEGSKHGYEKEKDQEEGSA